ncbi:MAG: hypothetical protein COA84_06820 [Robiginitomaculum sp.]|nr:MAG: hypothetical protein COA84_06820 [Robiginitomaculum sp.]
MIKKIYVRFRVSLLPLGALITLIIIAACSSTETGIDRRNPPVGGTAAEYGFQYAQAIAKNGNCDQALPIFICLGNQGSGWELATHSGGVCALEAAKLWSGPLHRRAAFFKKSRAISFDKPYYQSKAALYEKGLKMLHRAAAADWPDSQAALARALSAPGSTQAQLQEAKLWVARYDRNPRRKIYGSNSIEKNTRETLAGIPLPPDTDPAWIKKDLRPIPTHDPFCRSVLHTRPTHGQHPGFTPVEANDGNEDLPAPETVDQPGRPQPQ